MPFAELDPGSAALANAAVTVIVEARPTAQSAPDAPLFDECFFGGRSVGNPGSRSVQRNSSIWEPKSF
ncbi:MAG: hypothetical protein AB7G47_14870 [Mycolicibacterium sp.]|uniref:hypothetical protein n=1 Tax=Mycolicibacterium sp. TaxID=2320850 RepID=UPI003D0E9C8C